MNTNAVFNVTTKRPKELPTNWQVNFKRQNARSPRLIDAYEDGLLTKEEFEPRIRNSKQRLGTLEQDAAALADEQAKAEELRLVIGQLQEFSKRIADELQEPDWLSKREINAALVKRVEVGV